MTTGVTTTNLIAGCAVLIMAFAAGGALVQTQFAGVEKTNSNYATSSKDSVELLRKETNDLALELKAHVDRLEREQLEAARTSAREPVEKATVEAITGAIDKRIDLIQAQITDINRQIAAALIIIDNNSGVKKLSPAIPP